MEVSYSSFKLRTLKTLGRRKEEVNKCRCIKHTLSMKAVDLSEPKESWIKKYVVDCEHGEANCDCDFVLSIPYGYFFPISPTLELGDTIGPKSTYVRLVSSDKFRFIIKRKWVKNCLLLDSWFKNENQTLAGEEAEVYLKKYPSVCLHYLCVFLMYKFDYEVGKTLPSKVFTVPDTLVFSVLEMAHDLIV